MADRLAQQTSEPRLSAVVITPDRYETVARVMRSLHAQENRREMEVLLCAPTRPAAGPERPEWRDFAAVRILETGEIRIIAEVKALAVRQATAPVVAFTEEHALPDPGWAAALISRHREAHSVVGPMMVNLNPRLPISWANFVIEYGPWMSPAVEGPRSHLPGNNSSYKRDVLLGFGDRLAAVLDAETLLQWKLGAAGHSLYLEPRAVTRHMNVTRTDSFRKVHFQYGRLFAAQRRREWSGPRRLLYGVGSPLIPVIRLVRHASDIARNPNLPRRRPTFWTYLALGLIESACGECAGYLAGPGSAAGEVYKLEFHRGRHLDGADSIPKG
jgi:hypothetical protein